MKAVMALALIATSAFALVAFDGNQDKYSMVHLYFGVGQVRYDFLRSGATPGGQGEGVWAAGTCEMLVDGSVNPVVYRYGPPAGEVWAVYGCFMNYIYPVLGDDLEWGDSGAALTNGVYYRLGAAAATTGLFNLQRNGDEWADGMYAFYPIILRGDNGETLDVIIRDDLTVGGMGTTMSVYAYGYRIQ